MVQKNKALGKINGKSVVYANIIFFIITMCFSPNVSRGGEAPLNVMAEEGENLLWGIAEHRDEILLKSDKEAKEPVPEGPIIVPMDTIIVNLSGSNLRRYLKARVVFEVRDAEVKGKLDTRTIQVKDRLISIFSSKTIDDVDSVEGRELLKREIKDSVDVVLGVEKAILQVYFEEFVVQ